MRMLLVGNPNCGKTTLFNALTGEQQRVGNWPGVTIEKKVGFFPVESQSIELIDLPGVYSLVSAFEHASQDEQITAKTVASTQFDCIINVIDACHLERHLYLTSQLLELGVPVVIALNMMDLAEQAGIKLNISALSEQLGCSVISLAAHRGQGLSELKMSFMRPLMPPRPLSLNVCSALQDSLELLIADARYTAIHALVKQVQAKASDARESLTAKIDRVVLHRIWAFPIFFAMMYALFFFAIQVGGFFQDFFDVFTDALFVQYSSSLMQKFHMSTWFIALVSHGIGRGLNTTCTFIPVMACMYFFLSLLETSGYMARAAFVVDRFMRFLGLPGQAFVPMIIGFGCNVPAVMAARTLDSERDRLLTILMTPFMSCSARLAIYTVFVAAFFPTGGQNIVFLLYLIGIFMAVLTGFVLKHTLLNGPHAPLILELPVYHRPTLRRLFQETWLRLRLFVVRAAKLIVPVCVILGMLNAYSFDGLLVQDGQISILEWVGQHLTVIFSPMGISQDNWPATVGLLTGTLAKEVVVGTLNGLYAHIGDTHAYGVMAQQFDGKIGAFAYLLFILLYIPCVSTIAVIRQEATRRLMWFSIIWSMSVAYLTATLFYQLATFHRHPLQTVLWVTGILGLILLGSRFIYRHRMAQGASHVVATA